MTYIIGNKTINGSINFQNCSQEVIDKVQYKSSSMTVFGNFSNTIKLFNVFEDTFSCNGWCRDSYINPDFNISSNNCVNKEDFVSPCDCTNYDGTACNSCVDKRDNRTSCSNYTRVKNNLEKYLFTDVNR